MADAAKVEVCGVHKVAKRNARRPNGRLARVCRLCAAERLRRHRQAGGRKPDDPIKRRARKAVENALVSGALTRMPCQVCGEPKAHAHHEDYSRPLEVIWLCPEHHKARHREINAPRKKAATPKGGG